MSLVSLLDTLEDAGKKLEDRTGDRRERTDQVLLPIWKWLQEVASLSKQVDVDWVTADNSLSTEDEQKISVAVDALVESLDAPDERDFEAAMAELRVSFATAIQSAQDRLRVDGIEEQSIAALFLPIRSELASWTHREESDEVLTRARSALTQVGASGLAISFNDQFREDLKQANRFRVGAMFFFMLAVAWSIVAYVTLPSTVTAATIAGRGVIAVSLIVIGGFLTREANRHRTDANVWRTVQLQLNAIEAFCAAMPRANAEALRFMLGASVFSGPRLYAAAAAGHREQAEDNGYRTGDPNMGLEGSVREILSIVREVAETSRVAKRI
jgi:hypothetical protein